MKQLHRLRSKAVALVSATALTISGLLPMMLGTAGAAQMTNRALTLESSQPGATNQDIFHAFQFEVKQTTSIGSIELLYCTTPLGACTGPTGLDFTANGVTLTQQDIDGTPFADAYSIDTTGGDTTTNRLRLEAATGNAPAQVDDLVELTFDNIENPTVSSYSPAGNNTFFVRITTYGTTTYGTPLDNGVVASAIVPLLTVSARVQEILHFCVDNTSIDDDTTNIGSDCANLAGAVTGNSVDLGVVDGTTTGAVSPDAEGNSANGVFMIRTNAVGGSIVGYRAVQQTGTTYQGALRVVGSTCTGAANTVAAANSSTDQCFNSNTAKTALSASVEQFGMTGRYINRTSSATPTSNLSLATAYDSTSTEGYAWDQDGSFETVATSTPSTDKVIDDEAVILKFAAVSALTTPTGQYQAQSDFVAVPTY